MSNIDVSIIVNFHKEGRLAEATIESVKKSILHSLSHGIKSELIFILDRADDITKATCVAFLADAKIHETMFGDLSKARNFGVKLSSGRYITFIDGDDLWGYRWIYECFYECENIKSKNIVIHPKLNLYFGRQLSPYYWVHPDMRRDKIELADIAVSNRWTSLSFSRAETYIRFPYIENNIANGFGYEDWLWNIETIQAGFLHIVAPRTIHFIRRKLFGSLMQESNRQFVLPNIYKIL